MIVIKKDKENNIQIPLKDYREDDITRIVTGIKDKTSSEQYIIEQLKNVVGFIDLTSLEGTDTRKKIQFLCSRAINPLDEELLEKFQTKLHCAAVCVYPTFVSLVAEELNNSPVQTASVATGFPSGQIPLELKIKEVEYAVQNGADDIDMVINRGLFLSGDYQTVFDEIQQIKDVCKNAHLKVILEVGELETYQNIRLASDIAMHAGADFIKTSTGKIEKSSSLESVYVMIDAVRDYYSQSNRKIGIKPAGGIKTYKDVLHYMSMFKEYLGESWLTPELLRFGASSLLDNINIKLKELLLHESF